MTSKLPALCDSCKHLRSNGFSCPAFPKRIPDDIRVWGEDHRKIRAGQTGDTVWELKPGKEEELAAWEALR